MPETMRHDMRPISCAVCFTPFILLQLYFPLVQMAQDPYEGNKLYTLRLPKTSQLDELQQLRAKERLDCYTAIQLDKDVIIRVTPENMGALDGFIAKHNLKHSVSDMPPLPDSSRKLSLGQMSWDAYYNEYETVTWLMIVASKYSESVKIESIGKTYENRDIWVITIKKPGDTQTMGTFVDCLIHAREWTAGSTCTYMINELTANADKYQELLRNVTFYFIPILNPDGFNYTHNGHPIWRKNRRPNEGAPPEDDCIGVDLNRNFPHHWGGPGASYDQCYNEYLGPSACSELECQHLSKFLERHREKIEVYITIHTYASAILSPFSGGSELPADQDEIEKLTGGICKAVTSGGRGYTCGNANRNYIPLPGCSSDYAKIAGVKYTYLAELNCAGHMAPVSQILRTCQDMWRGVQVAASKKNLDGTPASSADCMGTGSDYCHKCLRIIRPLALVVFSMSLNFVLVEYIKYD